MKVLAAAVITACILLTGCGQESVGKSLGTAYVAHNSAVYTVIGLGQAGVMDKSELQEFNSYQDPVLEGLDRAFDAYFEDREDTVRSILEFVDPLLRRMTELAEGDSDE